jgi:hypothetical protein
VLFYFTPIRKRNVPMRTARHFAVMLLVCISINLFTQVIFASSPFAQKQSSRPTRTLVEEFSFEINNFKTDHQGESVLNIEIKLRFRQNMQTADYPDFRGMAKYVENFITNYPNETDYWEVVNKKMTQMLMDKYPVLISINSRIQISPQKEIPYSRASTTTRMRR